MALLDRRRSKTLDRGQEGYRRGSAPPPGRSRSERGVVALDLVYVGGVGLGVERHVRPEAGEEA